MHRTDAEIIRIEAEWRSAIEQRLPPGYQIGDSVVFDHGDQGGVAIVRQDGRMFASRAPLPLDDVTIEIMMAGLSRAWS